MLVRRRPASALSTTSFAPTSSGPTISAPTGISPSDEIVFVVPPMEFAATALKKAAKGHVMCPHPWDLSCALIRRWREVASQHTTRKLTLERMGVPRARRANGNSVS
jgi:hypothetical protein